MDVDFWVGMLNEVLGARGIFTLRHGSKAGPDHQLWFHQRKLASNIFSARIFRELIQDTFADKISRFSDVLDRVKPGDELDMQKCFFSFTMDSVMSIFFGMESNTLEGDPNRLAAAFDGALENLLRYLFKHYALLLGSCYLPWPLGAWGLRPAPGIAMEIHRMLSPEARKMREHIAVLEKEGFEWIRQRKLAPNTTDSGAKRRDLLTMFLESETFDGKSYDDRALLDVLVSFVIAGRDTTGT